MVLAISIMLPSGSQQQIEFRAHWVPVRATGRRDCDFLLDDILSLPQHPIDTSV